MSHHVYVGKCDNGFCYVDSITGHEYIYPEFVGQIVDASPRHDDVSAVGQGAFVQNLIGSTVNTALQVGVAVVKQQLDMGVNSQKFQQEQQILQTQMNQQEQMFQQNQQAQQQASQTNFNQQMALLQASRQAAPTPAASPSPFQAASLPAQQQQAPMMPSSPAGSSRTFLVDGVSTQISGAMSPEGYWAPYSQQSSQQASAFAALYLFSQSLDQKYNGRVSS